jgi:hypothetical protein
MTSNATGTTASGYPLSAGYKDDSTSKAAARAVDANSVRLLDCYARIVLTAIMEPHYVIDEVAESIHEPILYVRPRASELFNLGILSKGAKRVSPTHGRQAHVYAPAEDIVWYIAENDPTDLVRLERVIRTFIAERIAADRAARAAAKRGSHV